MAEFQHNDVTYTVVPTEQWDFRDAVFAKQASGGMSVVEIETGARNMDPDAMVAFLAVSVRRVREEASAERLRDELVNSGVPLMRLIEQLAADEIGQVADDPSVAAESGE